jgi:hypothetical protein
MLAMKEDDNRRLSSFSLLAMFDIIVNLLLSAVYTAVGSIFSVDTLQSVFYFVSSVITSETLSPPPSPQPFSGPELMLRLSQELPVASVLVRPATVAAAASFPVKGSFVGLSWYRILHLYPLARVQHHHDNL